MRQVLTIAASPVSTAGLGLLMWSGMTTAALQLRPGGASTLDQLQLIGIALGGAIVACGTLMQRLAGPSHLPTAAPTRRTRLLRWATLGIALLLWALLRSGAWRQSGLLLVTLGVALLLAAFGSVTAMASDHGRPPSPPAWQQPLVLPVHLLLAMSTGLALLYLLMDRLFVSGNDGRTMLATLTGLGACAALCKLVYWREIDRLPGAGVAPPFSGARVAVIVLAAGGPLLGWLLALYGRIPATGLLLVAASSLLAAAVLEHRLFLGEGATMPGASATAS